MKPNKEKLILLIMDSIQVFYEKKDYYSQIENQEALSEILPEDGRSVSQLVAFVNNNTSVSSWYKEAKSSVNLLELDEDTNYDKLKNQLCMVDLIAGFSLYNLIVGAKFNLEMSDCLDE